MKSSPCFPENVGGGADRNIGLDLCISSAGLPWAPTAGVANNSGSGNPGFNFLTMSESLAEVGVAPGGAIFLSGIETAPPVAIVSVESQESNTNGTLFLSLILKTTTTTKKKKKKKKTITAKCM